MRKPLPKGSRRTPSSCSSSCIWRSILLSWGSMLVWLHYGWVHSLSRGITELTMVPFTSYLSSDSPVSGLRQPQPRLRPSTVKNNSRTEPIPKQPWNVYSHQELCNRLFLQANHTPIHGSFPKYNSSYFVQPDRRYCHWGSTGNHLGSIFMTRLIAEASGYEFQLSCREQYSHDAQYNLQSVPYHLPARSYGRRMTNSGNHSLLPSWQQLCRKCDSHFPHGCQSGLEWIAPIMRRDLQQMSNDWLSQQERQRPLAVQLDETIIHLRCGDILARHVFGARDYGYSPYSAYDMLWDNSTSASVPRSIGIITNTFDSTKCRHHDCPFVDTCRILVLDLVDYLRSKLPAGATIRMYNSQKDTVWSSYARMVLANQVFCDSSSFCVFPAVASRGYGYITRPEKLYPWVGRVADKEPNVKIVQPKHYLGVTEINRMRMNATAIVKWRRDH